MTASPSTTMSRAESGVNRPPIKSLFCERFGCPPAKYREQAFKRCLYPHARLLAPLILLLRPGFFRRDLGFIEYLGHIRHLSDAIEAASEFHDKGGFENEFSFTVLKIRVSGSRAVKLARELFRPRRSRVRGATEPA